MADLYDKAFASKMPDALKTAVTDFYGNPDRLHKEWDLCTREYRKNLTLSRFSGATFDQKLVVKKVADYWSRRRAALETAIPKETVAEWKAAEVK